MYYLLQPFCIPPKGSNFGGASRINQQELPIGVKVNEWWSDSNEVQVCFCKLSEPVLWYINYTFQVALRSYFSDGEFIPQRGYDIKNSLPRKRRNFLSWRRRKDRGIRWGGGRRRRPTYMLLECCFVTFVHFVCYYCLFLSVSLGQPFWVLWRRWHPVLLLLQSTLRMQKNKKQQKQKKHK